MITPNLTADSELLPMLLPFYFFTDNYKAYNLRTILYSIFLILLHYWDNLRKGTKREYKEF